MYFDIYLNDRKVATVGPSNLEHLGISISGHRGDVSLLANGLSEKEDGQRYYTWLEEDLGNTDVVRVVPSDEKEPSVPIKTRNLRRGQKASKESVFCDFCKRGEDEAGKIIQAGETPFICEQCAELCLEIFKGRGDEA